MKLNLKTVYANFQQLTATKAPEKAVSRFMSGAGKSKAGLLCSDGFAAQELATAYIQWLTDDVALQGLLHKNTLLNDVYYFMTVARNVADEAVMVKEVRTTYQPTGSIQGDIRGPMNGVQAVQTQVKHKTIEEALTYLAPVDIDEVVESLSYEDYLKYLTLKPVQPTDYNDIRRVIALKLIAAPYWHPMNEAKLREEAKAKAEQAEVVLDEAYEQSIVDGMEVPEFHVGLSRREVMVYEIMIDGMQEVPEELKEFRTRKVLLAVAGYTRKATELRQARKAKLAEVAKAKAFKDQLDAMDGQELPIRNYNVKAKVNGLLEMAKGVSSFTAQAFWGSQLVANPSLHNLTRELLDVFGGDIAKAQAALSHTDFATDPLIVIDRENKTVEHAINYKGNTLTASLFEQYNTKVDEVKAYFGVDVPVKPIVLLKELASKYKELTVWELKDEVQVRAQLEAGDKNFFHADAQQALEFAQSIVTEFKLKELEAKVSKDQVVNNTANWL